MINIPIPGKQIELDPYTHSPKPLQSCKFLFPKQDQFKVKFYGNTQKNGDYQVKKAYEFLVMDHLTLAKQAQTQEGVWNLIWRVKVPLKINNFTWKLMHDSLPTLLSLKNRGISTSSTCPLCNEEDESTTHLFLLCPFTRACWHGSTLAIHSLDFINIFVQHWLTLLLSKYKVRGIDSIVCLQATFMTLWTI